MRGKSARGGAVPKSPRSSLTEISKQRINNKVLNGVRPRLRRKKARIKYL